jgi:glycosyltransferase involved in cell wall biosynthesis
MTLRFLHGHVGFMKEQGVEVLVISSPGPDLEAFGATERVGVYAIEMPRRITPTRDLRAVCRIWRQIRLVRPEIVHAHTPKGGLLATVAAWLARIPVRVYHIHGLPMLTAAGPRRLLLRWSERVACRLATQVLCVSNSVRRVAIAERLCPAAKIKVLAGGTINGVDAAGRFNPANLGPEVRHTVRGQQGIPMDALVVGFVGRIVRDKGMVELVGAWQVLRERFPSLHLLIVGPFEAHDPLPPVTVQVLRADARIHLVGLEWKTPPLYAAMDLLVLPTYREGFPTVLLEAGAMELPVVATRVPGCTDAVVDGQTGLLAEPRDIPSLIERISTYLVDSERRRRHGHAARERVLQEFGPELIWEATWQEYVRLMTNAGRPLVSPTVRRDVGSLPRQEAGTPGA